MRCVVLGSVVLGCAVLVSGCSGSTASSTRSGDSVSRSADTSRSAGTSTSQGSSNGASGTSAPRQIAASASGPAWTRADRLATAASPNTAVFAAQVTPDGDLRVLRQLGPSSPRPLASAVKLYVMTAVVLAVEDHGLSWDQQVTPIPQDHAAGSSGTAVVGVPMTLAAAAHQMMYNSDNTAASMLIRLVGQPRLQHALAVTGMSAPSRLTPLLTLRQDIWMEWSSSPAAVQARAAWPTASAAERVRLAAPGNTEPQDGVGAAQWQHGLGYFATAADLARALLWLHAQFDRPGMAPLPQVLNSAGSPTNTLTAPPGWTTTIFKSGAAPGIATGAWLAHTAHGDVVLVVLGSSTGSVSTGSLGAAASAYAQALVATASG